MIKEENISIKISNKTISYYRQIVSSDLNIGDIIEISSFDLQNGSHVKITGICDFCYSERKISKKSYNLQTNLNTEKFSCSKKCSILKSKETNLEKWGVENIFQSTDIKEKIKKTNLEKWGVENPQQSEIIRNKTENTNLYKWGYKTPSMSNIIKNKTKISNNIKFGVDYPSQSNDIKIKTKLNCYKKWGVDNFSKTSKFKDILRKSSFNKMLIKLKSHGDLIFSENGAYKIKCSECNREFDILHTLMYNRILNGDIICTHCNPKNKPIKESEIYSFILENYNGIIIRNDRNLISNELDIYLPELNLAFEFNGLYWHSELYKEKNYHYKKSREAMDNNIQLIHIWEDDWKYKNAIIKSIILNKLGKSKRIFARKCEVREIDDNKIVREFLNINHLQGFVGSSIKLGLFYNGEMVSLMTFGKLRKSLGQCSKDDQWELIRFCNKLNTNVIGGASKLLKYFMSNYNYSKIISYSDNSRSDGKMYKKLGFTLKSETTINYYWVVDGIRRHRFNFRKDKLVKEGFNKNKTEIEIMNEIGHYRIFDCGLKKWIIDKI